jgi:hypothetical protein
VWGYLEVARLLAVGLKARPPGRSHRGRRRGLVIFLFAAYTASTAAVRFKSLQQLYGWLNP